MGGKINRCLFWFSLFFFFLTLLCYVSMHCLIYDLGFANPLVKRRKEKKKPQGFSFVLCERLLSISSCSLNSGPLPGNSGSWIGNFPAPSRNAAQRDRSKVLLLTLSLIKLALSFLICEMGAPIIDFATSRLADTYGNHECESALPEL